MRWVLLLCLATLLTGKEAFIVISNSHFPVKYLTAQQLKQIYLKRMRFIEVTPLVPINYDARDQLRNRFEGVVLKMSHKKLSRYWAKEHYLGRRPPVVQSSIEGAIAFVRKVDGAIAYIPDSRLPSDILLLYRERMEP